MRTTRHSVLCPALLGAVMALLVAGCGGGEGSPVEEADPGGQAAVGGARGGGGGGVVDESGSPCPGCAPGGETSDIGGTPSICSLFTKRDLVSEAEANALGFDVTSVRERAERPIEATLRWLPQATEAGEPAEGYEPETEVRASITVRSYVHEYPDPDLCDGTTCRGDEGSGEIIEVQQADCYSLLFVGADVTLETLDGALSAQSLDDPDVVGTDSIALLLLGPEGLVNHDPPGGTVNFDLADVTGSLRIFPHVPEPYVGVLYADFIFAEPQTRGFLSVNVFPDWDAIAGEDGTGGADIPSELSSYTPLRAEWPAN
ncbi:MAG: hypothetical protein OEZ06_25565 [Myxococcales bacterium]|nr:hypothetical protein [Myxococcales bacterium]